MERIKLSKLLECINIVYKGNEEVEGISDRSEELQSNWLFVCLKGSHNDGHDHIDYAQSRGAFVLAQKILPNTFYTKDTRKAFALLVHAFYHYPCNALTLIGVTGTNGKSTVTTLLTQLFTFFNKKTLLIGTSGIYLDQKYVETKNTTPDILTLVRLFHEAIQQNIDYVIMEVSSIALATSRVEGIFFDVAILTNAYQDHLDFHGTLQKYYEAKFKLFTQLKPKGVALINEDDPIGRTFIGNLKYPVLTYGQNSHNFKIAKLNTGMNQSSFFLNEHFMQTRLISNFNIYNLVPVLATAFIFDFNYPQTELFISQLQPIKGRLQTIISFPFTIWVDYAHTPSALAAVLEFANCVKKTRIITVFGCGGEREVSKRSKMGEIACIYSDIIIITMDNPRSEDPENIITDIRKGCDGRELIVIDRYEAIKFAIKSAISDDIIIVAGKGSEQNQILDQEIVAFDDEGVIHQILSREDIECF